MLSASVVRNHFFKLVELGRKNGLVVEFYNNEKIYQLEITPTDKPFVTPPRKKYKPQYKPVTISTGICPSCDGLQAAGICLNKACESNKKDTPE